MRIIAKNHDYYDSFSSMDDLIYLRTPKEVTDIPVKLHTPDEWPRSNSWSFDMVCIGFCGKVYHGYRFYLSGTTLCSKWLFSLQEIEEFYKERNWKIERGLWNKDTLFNRYAFLESDNKSGKFRQWFEKYQCPIFICEKTNWAWARPTEKDYEKYGKIYFNSTIINDTLKKFGFARIFPPKEAFQEISMFLGNMHKPEKEIPPIDDVTLAEAKGFNKFSFRKDPTKKPWKR